MSEETENAPANDAVSEQDTVVDCAETVSKADYDRVLLAYAEADNQIKRLEKNRIDAVRYAVQSFARDLLDVADSVEQAVASVNQAEPSIESIKNGLTTIQKCIVHVFERHSLQAIRPEGSAFDPYLHEAVAQVPVQDAAQINQVLHVMQVGYKLDDRLLRPARVVVGQAAS